MNSIQLTSKKVNNVVRQVSLALILRNSEFLQSSRINNLLNEIDRLFGVNVVNSSSEYKESEKLFEILGNPENILSFSEGLGRKANLTIYIVGESELRYNINIINPDLDAIRDYQSFITESSKYAYNFFFKDLVKEKSLKNIDFKAIQQIMTSLNVWHGDIEIFGGIQPGILIEDNSNNPSKEFFKTIIQSIKLQAALTPYTKDSDGNAISTKISYKADLNMSLISDIFKDGSILRNISVDITFDDKNSLNNFSAIRNYSTKINEDSSTFTEVYDLFQNLLKA